ncbi:MAG: hypothetical protein AUJ52_15525 [Elusimicrobia bacterium CG1_02_63_36]|nr:MAG: hypothetical protein AUJ52_15525 [Elusimicrobia bacterium CG1_02_63_36]PIP81718.1 MAG: hypothetical protein COR54_18855 [Elusimicrobia bacterium CG22_combo_CG10-13_8_21_14_all_63_91]PJA13884.1 MAG: hypothetical protein COX66_13970 [Elusimicrobia bacterium CG_4_10_14_0_2_um_filter_63_34]PJB24790.1 MAG: hypothetical protein CO113_12150 [Elusimicrobia bacterium CG_4_9_14_3_um_filter_62_55]
MGGFLGGGRVTRLRLDGILLPWYNRNCRKMKHFSMTRAGFAIVIGALLIVGCKPPKYIRYRSEAGDIAIQVPYGWSVYLDRQGNDFYSYNFVGPFEPDFYRGVPSLSVRWYKTAATHRMRMGLSETYYSADDYIATTLREVYGRERFMKTEVQEVSISGWRGKHFVVVSPKPAEKGERYGVSTERGGKETVVLREHAYAVLPMDNGFYVIIYPATAGGYAKYADRFNHLVNTFKALKDGPGGPAVKS